MFDNDEQVAVIARRRLGAPPEAVYALQPLVGQALSSLAHKVARSDNFVELRKEQAITCTAGVVTLTDTSLLLDMLDKTSTLILNGKEAKWVARFDDLRAKLPTDIYWAALRGRKILVKDIATGNLGTASVFGLLEASYSPKLSELPDALNEDLIDEVVRMAQSRTDTAAQDIEGKQSDINNVRFVPND